jgi:polyferredoxin
MAYELQLRENKGEVKIRSPWAAALLPFITFGIYHLVWWYRINRELRDFGRAKGYDLGQSPTKSLLALFPGSLIIVPALVTYWNGTKRVQGAARVAGNEAVNGWIALVLYLLLAPVFWAYVQVSLNDIWRKEAEPMPGQSLPPAPGDKMPPRLPATEPARPPESEPPPETGPA